MLHLVGRQLVPERIEQGPANDGRATQPDSLSLLVNRRAQGRGDLESDQHALHEPWIFLASGRHGGNITIYNF